MGKQKAQSFYRTVLWDASTIEMAVHRPMGPSQHEKVSRWGWPDEMQSELTTAFSLSLCFAFGSWHLSY